MAENKALLVKKDLYWVGALNPDLRVFDIIMTTPFGTTYNSFLLKGSKANVLFETVKEETFDQFEKRLESVLKPDEKIDFVVLNHTEPDHSGALALLVARFPDVTIVATKCALRNIEQICNCKFPKTIGISADECPVIDVGGYTLHFIISPFLHWPDTMITHIPELKTIVTCDFFGAHYSNPLVFNDEVSKDPKMKADMLSAYKNYFDCIFGPFKPFVLQGLEKLKAVEYDTICCSHGPVLREDLPYYLELYRNWATPVMPTEPPLVVIAHVSAYEFTKKLAEAIGAAIEATGLRVKMFDLIHADLGSVMAAVNEAKGLLVGTPTLVGEALPPVWDIVSRLNPIVHAGMTLGVFGSYGWSGEGLRNIQGRLAQLTGTMSVPLYPFGVVFKPSAQDMVGAKKWGEDFAAAVKKHAALFKPGTVVPHGCPQLESPAALMRAPYPGALRGEPVRKRDGRLKRWKCLICDEIILSVDEPEMCPVCGATGPESFVIVGYVDDAPDSGEDDKKQSLCTLDEAPQAARKSDGRMRRWRCIVCGEIILSVDVPVMCAVCGATSVETFECLGFVDEPKQAVVVPCADRRVVIIGAGAAGFNAAKRIREVDRECQVVVVNREQEMPYNRPIVTDLVADPSLKQTPKFKLAEDGWFGDMNVEILCGAEATAVDTGKRVVTVSCDGGKTHRDVPYTRLIIATGGNNFVPEPNLPTENVFNVRTSADIDRLLAYVRAKPDCEKTAKIAIMGGGLAALELAESFTLVGFKHVDVIEMMPRILPRQLTEDASALFKKAIEAKGVKLHLGATAKVYNKDKTNARLVSLELSSGDVVHLDALCFAIGTRQEKTLAAKIGCKVETGIVVDACMRTTVPDVYACGDCAQFDGFCVANWMESVSEGRIAGFNALVSDESAMQKYVRKACPYLLDAFGGAFSVGKVDTQCRRMVMSQLPAPGNHVELFFDDENKVLGAIAVGPEATTKLQASLTIQVQTRGTLSCTLQKISQVLA